MALPKNLVLVGPMGAGKTTLGKQLASQLGYTFIDTDHVVEERSGADIPWIFDVEGEQGFRQREAAVLADTLGQEGAVIATGGGIVLAEANRSLLKSNSGIVIYLIASIDQLVRRTCKDKKRPLLQVANPQEKIKSLFETRHPLYLEVSDHILDTNGKSQKNLVTEVLSFF